MRGKGGLLGRRARHSRGSMPSLVGGGFCTGSAKSPGQPTLVPLSRKSTSCTYLTCSLTNLVRPFTSPSGSKLAKNNSPRKAFKGFFTPSFSSRPAYCCCLRAARNHFNTSKARFCGSGSEAGATKIDGCSAQYAGNSTADFVARTKGGAVMLLRSPRIVAID